jgi:hypothetical protein
MNRKSDCCLSQFARDRQALTGAEAGLLERLFEV